MRKADTFFRYKSKLVTDLVVSIKEIYAAIWKLTGNRVINFYAYRNLYAYLNACGNVSVPVSSPVWAPVFDGNKGPTDGVEYGTITYLYRSPAKNDEDILLETHSNGGRARIQSVYDYSMDELIYVYDELEKIYKYEKNRNK